jgi:predicted ATPase
MKIVDIANEIYIESGSPTTTSIAAISFWIRGKVGHINNLLQESFVIDETTKEILDGGGAEISMEAVSIIKKLYKVYDYEIQIRTHMNAITTDTVLEVEDNGSRVKKINRNEVSKTFASLKAQEEAALKNLVTNYRQRLSGPVQITGDDIEQGRYGEIRIPNLRRSW